MIATVTCPACGLSNSVEVRTCRRCGRALMAEPRPACPRCLLPNDPRSYLCWKCGAPLPHRSRRRRRLSALPHDTCPHCGVTVPVGKAVCPACHAPLAVRAPGGLRCRQCGLVQRAGAQVCSRCGELVAPFVGEVAGEGLCIANAEGSLEVLIPRGAPVPSARPIYRVWRPPEGGAGTLEIPLYADAKDGPRRCARLVLHLPEEMEPAAEITLAFALDASGLPAIEAQTAGVETHLEWEVGIHR